MSEEKKMENPVALCKVIDGSVYLVRVHFKEDTKEDMKAKIKKLMVKDLIAS